MTVLPLPAPAATDHRWWQRGVIYQIYPLSFMDSNGDGWGDLAGITSRLDYVRSLAVDAIWLSPIHPSPMVDWGYDVANYLDVDARFGTLADFDRLVAEAHRRELRVILDLVPNHTSDQHAWFLESRSSRSNPKRDWYIWRDPGPGGAPPNNWMSYFGPAWTLDPTTGQSYYHQFRAEQPELNYGNPAVLAAMLEVMRFWLDRGVDGFRVDVIALMAKDPRFLDEPDNPNWIRGMPLWHRRLHRYTEDQPAVHDIIRAMRGVLDEYPGDRVMLGELDPVPGLMDYYGKALDEVQLPFNFNLLEIDWSADTVRDIIERYEADLPAGAWPTWVLGNHDRPRIANRVGPRRARLAQMLLLTLRGTPICYYGDELGMADVDVPPERQRDFAGLVLDDPDVTIRSRDPERSPMPWDSGPNAGFAGAGVEPWLPLGPDVAHQNVAAEDLDPRSMLTLYRRLTAVRRGSRALSVGSYRTLDAGVPDVLAYERSDGSNRCVIALNFSGVDVRARLPSMEHAEIVVSTLMDCDGPVDLGALPLRPFEGLLAMVDTR
jgi:alpha-glucosidase